MNTAKRLFLFMVFLSVEGLATAQAQPARQRGPCVEQAQVRHRAHMALRACIEDWMKDRAGTPDPTEDCSVKLTAFVQAAKLTKECRAAQKTK